MSYYSRVYRHRNPRTSDEAAKDPFFSKQNDTIKAGQKSAFFQAKLSVNEPGDKYEREADSVANAVVNQSAKPAPVQQKQAATKEEKKEINKKDQPVNDEEKKKKIKPVQAKQDGPANTASPQVSSKIENSSGKGNSLPPKTLHEMNSSFGVDFSGVNVHDDNEAINMNKELNAQAFTHGRDIYFNQGKYNPDNREGKFLLAHELTHVVQQGEYYNIQKKDDKNKKKQKLPQNFICYTGGHSGIVSVFKNGVLIFSGDAVSGQPGSKQNEKGSGPTPDGVYVVHPQKTNSPVDKGQGGTCAANAISSGYQELSSNEKFTCDHPSHYCTESCAESPVNHCFTPVGCWGTKRIKIEGSAQVVADDGKRITRSGFYFHGGNPSNLASSGCIKVLDNNFFTKARELKGSIPVFIGTTCPGLDPNSFFFPFKSLFDWL
jgi:hypothetical protein